MKFLINCIVLVLVLSCSSVRCASEISDALSEFIEKTVVEDFLPKSKATGVGLTVVHQNGTILYNSGFGLRDVEANSPITNQTIFPIGSITKSFVSTMVIKILSEKFPQYGENVLEMPIRILAPSLNFTLNDRYRSESGSFRDLLSHRSCESSHINSMFFGVHQDPSHFVYKTRYENEICPFRSTYVYNNAFYNLAGRLIGQIAGDSFENLARTLLDQMGMTETKLIDFNEDYDTLPNMVQGYYVDENGTLTKYNSRLLRPLSVVNPAGGAISSTTDMGKYIYFHMNHGMSVTGEQIIPQVVHQWLKKPSIPVQGGVSYGLGFLLDYHGEVEPFMTHSGYWPPYASTLTILPGRFGIFSSTNGPGATTPSSTQVDLHNQIALFLFESTTSLAIGDGISRTNHLPQPLDILSDSQQLIGTGRKSEMSDSEVSDNIILDCTSDDDLIGVYGHPIEGQLEISRGPTALKLTYGLYGEGDLEKLEECKFQIKWTTDVVAIFYTYMDGGDFVNILEFPDNNNLNWWFQAAEALKFVRNLSDVDLPEIPYDPDSCVAENFGR